MFTGAAEAISREQALRLYTSAASHYMFDEAKKGTIEPGKFADLRCCPQISCPCPKNRSKTSRFRRDDRWAARSFFSNN